MAGDCSYKYLMKNDNPETFDPDKRGYYLVTVSVDRVDFMDKLSADRDLKLSAYMLMARGSSLMVKIDVLQRSAGEQSWQSIGDALIIFVARDSTTNKAYKIPEMRHSTYDDVLKTQKCMQIGLTIKDWSQDKSRRDMKSRLPDFSESLYFNNYLRSVDQLREEDPDAVVTMDSTKRSNTLLMQY